MYKERDGCRIKLPAYLDLNKKLQVKSVMKKIEFSWNLEKVRGLEGHCQKKVLETSI
jgi:hypothetical protein